MLRLLHFYTLNICVYEEVEDTHKVV